MDNEELKLEYLLSADLEADPSIKASFLSGNLMAPSSPMVLAISMEEVIFLSISGTESLRVESIDAVFAIFGLIKNSVMRIKRTIFVSGGGCGNISY